MALNQQKSTDELPPKHFSPLQPSPLPQPHPRFRCHDSTPLSTQNLDSYLTNYGWQERLGLSPHKRIFVLIAAYAHDGGH